MYCVGDMNGEPLPIREEKHVNAIIKAVVKRGQKVYWYSLGNEETGEAIALIFVALGSNARQWLEILQHVHQGENVTISYRELGGKEDA